MTPDDQIILRAASDLMRDVGDAFTIDQLVARASIPRATVYRRIGSKQALLERLMRDMPTALPSSVQPRDARTRILYAARRAFARHGLAGATIEQIASEAGVGVATVYRHFGDKDHVVWAFINELSPRPFVRDLARPTQDIAEDLTSLAATLLPFFYEYRDILRLILTGNDAERAYIEHLRTGSDRTLDQIAAYFQAQMDAGRLPVTEQSHEHARELALAFIGLLFAFGMIGPTHYGTTLDAPDRIAALIGRLFAGGLQPSAGEEDQHGQNRSNKPHQRS